MEEKRTKQNKTKKYIHSKHSAGKGAPRRSARNGTTEPVTAPKILPTANDLAALCAGGWDEMKASEMRHSVSVFLGSYYLSSLSLSPSHTHTHFTLNSWPCGAASRLGSRKEGKSSKNLNLFICYPIHKSVLRVCFFWGALHQECTSVHASSG